MRIERPYHAADRFLHQLVIVDVIDVFALDALVDFGKETRLFPRQCCGSGSLQRIALSSCYCIAGKRRRNPATRTA